MSTSDHLAFLIGFNSGAMHRAMDDVTEEESMTRGADGSSHIRWLTGHLIESTHHVLELLGGSYELPKSYGEAFKPGNDASGNADDYPSMEELRTTLFDVREALKTHVESVDESVLAESLGEKSPFPTKLHFALFMCEHDFYHLGQMVTIRRAIGRERPFG